MKKVGAFNLGFETERFFYSDDNKVFYSDKNDEISSEIKELETWALISNSPWSQVNEKYVIKVNCKDGYTEIAETEPTWECTYIVVGYEGMSAEVTGYGNTEEEALKSCKDLFKYIQEIYNKEDDSI